ncbi:MAG TPA: YdeI/OmpD-associated family protein [Coriobacteriia bacterium]
MCPLQRPVHPMPAGTDLPLLEVADRAELRAWLESDHATSRGVRLVIGKKGNAVTALTYDDAVEEGLCFGWIDSTARRLDADRYTVQFTPRKPGSVWARTNKARVERLATAGLMTPAGLAVVEAARAGGSWDLLDHVDDLTVPGDLADALAACPGAADAFGRLSASARRMALYWIASAKRPGTRARRVSATVDAAMQGRQPST